ncbi:MAG: hypothetical protein HGA31_01315 [Candidatus Moranbacteria bacterium]|nr:hypothetical protein [Candidatus Moranbacteria bacterium]
MFFGNRKKEQIIDTSSNAELYQGIRVMQDDLDELSGKPPAVASVSSAESAPHTGASSGSPFLSDQYLAQTATKNETRDGLQDGIEIQEPSPSVKSAENIDRQSGAPIAEVFSGLKNFVSNIGSNQDTVEEESEHETVQEVNGSGQDPVASGKSWILLASALALIALVAGAAAYVFIFSRTGGNENQTPVVGPNQADTEQSAQSIQSTESETIPFTQGMPNYLSIDIESEASTPEGILKLLSDTDASVMKAKPSFPVEFIIRDANNNPVAFARFAYLLGLKIPLETLTSLDEGFSLFFVFDGNAARRVVVIDVRQGKDVSKDMKDGETSLVSWFGTMLYPTAVSISSGTSFQSGSYGKLTTRFINIDSADDTSFDYAIMDDALVIGTSKDAFRSVLGTIVGSK